MLFAGCSVNNTQNQDNSSVAGSSSSSSRNDSILSSCINVAGGYSFNYPSEWKIWEHALGAYEETYCDVARSNITLSPDVPDAIGSRMDFIVNSGTELNPAPNSLDDYFTKNPDIIRSGTRIPGINLAGRAYDMAPAARWHDDGVLLASGEYFGNCCEKCSNC